MNPKFYCIGLLNLLFSFFIIDRNDVIIMIFNIRKNDNVFHRVFVTFFKNDRL